MRKSIILDYVILVLFFLATEIHQVMIHFFTECLEGITK